MAKTGKRSKSLSKLGVVLRSDLMPRSSSKGWKNSSKEAKISLMIKATKECPIAILEATI